MTFRILQGAALALAVGALSSGLAFALGTSPALALDGREAEAVVSVMEVLTEQFGEGMTTDAADAFFDYDSVGDSLIPSAGFDRAGWVEAYNAVSAGYLATIPQEDINAMFAEPLALLEAAALPDEQKAPMRTHIEGLLAEALAMREGGMAYVETVRPLESRLYPLFFGEF